ncbi:MAG: ATP-dependent zinc metalloprotease FtsH [Culicoidibacterales bacterium]
MAAGNPNEQQGQKKSPLSGFQTFTVWLFVLMALFGIFLIFRDSGTTITETNYTTFVQELTTEEIEELNFEPVSGEAYSIIYTKRDDAVSETTEMKPRYTLTVPYSDEVVKLINDNLAKVKVVYSPLQTPGPFISGLLTFLPFLLLAGVMFFFMNRAAGANGKAMEFGKSRAKLQQGSTVKYRDVAGYEEEKQELVEVVDFLKHPQRYRDMGARIPKGMLLVGPPGTGKTLLARATAGEAGVPFYTISGSDFLEMFVGVGASRVRDMFNEAKKQAPAIIFIDEIDAVGRQRGAGVGGGHDEREQTLNQLLVEMDGFDPHSGIVIMAATNRPDVLDPALLRPGRFDRQITVNVPDVHGREKILAVHAENKHLAPDVDLKAIAKRTPGFSGADLENLLNESALLAVRENRSLITMRDIDEATDRVIAGPAKKSRKYSEEERRLVAFHEAGHAVIGLTLDDASIVQKVTIIPRGQAGGYNLMIPKEERFFSRKGELLDQIIGFLGGRVAEELTFGDVSTGAHNDFERSTAIARSMVTEYGMSNLGPIQYERRGGSVFLGRDYGKEQNFSDQIALDIDLEVRKIIDECYDRTRQILTEQKELLTNIAEALLAEETLTYEQIMYIKEHGVLPPATEYSDQVTDAQIEAKIAEINATPDGPLVETPVEQPEVKPDEQKTEQTQTAEKTE